MLFFSIDVKCLLLLLFWPWLTVVSRVGKTSNFKKNIDFSKRSTGKRSLPDPCVGGIKIRGSEQSSCRRRFLPSPVSRNANIHHKRLEIQAQRQVNIARQKNKILPISLFFIVFCCKQKFKILRDDHLVSHLCFCMSTIRVCD